MSTRGDGLRRIRSNVSDMRIPVDGLHVGPLAGPTDMSWRRQRLLNIGEDTQSGAGTPSASGAPTEAPPSPTRQRGERAVLRTNTIESYTYGTMPPSSPTRSRKLRSRLSLGNFGRNLGKITIPRYASLNSRPPSSGAVSPNSVGEFPSLFRSSRPISAYDHAAFEAHQDPDLTNNDVKVNGIRVWYSSFTSIDWLHDAIKDSARRARLRKHKSFHGRMRRNLDRSLGWIIVSLVGFLTAVIAFMIIRGEQLMFDMKEGYCTTAWYKAKRFCCPRPIANAVTIPPPFVTMFVSQEPCPEWRTWADTFMPSVSNGQWFSFESELVEYTTYTLIAIALAITSCILTLKLTASSSFVTNKDSGVLSPDFVATATDGKSNGTTMPEPKRKVMYYAAGSGIPEVKTILSGFVIHGYLGGRTLFTKAVGLSLSVASGLSLGKEGPFVHIASCVGNIVSRWFHKYENNEAKRREILSAACAAGVAVAFGAPIGGVLFSLEEVSYFFPPKVMWRSFFCAMVAAMTLKFLDPFGSGKLVLFQVTYDRDWHAYELVFFLILGVIGGVWGAWFSKLNVRWTKHVRNGTWLKTHPVVEVFLVTLATSVLCFLNPYTRMGGTELVYNLFAECRPGNTHSGLCILNPPEQALPVIGAISVALVVKGALTIITFGIKLPAGIFIPSLGVGACVGRIMGILVQWMQYSYPNSRIFQSCSGNLDCVVPGLYAMVGAAASLSGVTRTTVSLAVIMFELTDTLTYVVPVMLSVLVAKTVADALEPKGIYDLVIEVAQLPYLDAKANFAWGYTQISEVADRDVEVIHIEHNNTVKSLRDKLQALMLAGHEDSGLPILRDDGQGSRLVGYIGASELEHALIIVADSADMSITFHVTSPYHQADMTSSYSTEEPETGSLLGMGMGNIDPFDFSYYMDQAPLTVQSNSPLELVQQLFTKLGARYVVVTDTDGYYEGVIDKKTWLAFLGQLEGKA